MPQRPLSHAWLLPLAASLAAQVSASVGDAYAQPPLRRLGAPTAATDYVFSGSAPGPVGTWLQVVPVRSGHVLIGDVGRRVVLLLDSLLQLRSVVLDSTPGLPNTFPTGSFISAFRGDSALLFHRTAGVNVVITPDGRLGRTFALPPRAGGQAAGGWLISIQGPPLSSQSLGLVYRHRVQQPAVPRPGPGEPDKVRLRRDSLLVLRMNYDTREVDTIVQISRGTAAYSVLTSTENLSGSAEPIPLLFHDDVVVTTDGSVGIFRAREFRFTWVNPDGSRSEGPRIPFPWRVIPAAERDRILDSANTARRVKFDSLVTARMADSLRSGGSPVTTIQARGSDGVMVTRRVAIPPPRLILAEEDEVPSYYPPTGAGAVVADGDNNVWIRPILKDPNPGGEEWHVYDRSGVLIDRVLIPSGTAIAGFGAGRALYLLVRDAGRAAIERHILR